MSRVKVSHATVIWVLGRVLRPVTRRRWASLQLEAEALLRQDHPERCLIGRGAFRDHAVYQLMGFQAICGQPVDSVSGGDMPGDINCRACRHRLNKAAGVVMREQGATA
jgi:hypothetical protein